MASVTGPGPDPAGGALADLPDLRLAGILPRHADLRDGHLLIGGCDTIELAERFGTPLYVYDEQGLEEECLAFARTMAAGPAGSRGLYALKAFPSVAMARVAHEAGLGLLCASGGELAVAEAAGVPAADRVLHGNNKSEEELAAPVGRLIVDSFDEIDRLERLGIDADVWLRVAPGIEAGAFPAVRTGGVDTKFGLPLEHALAAAARLVSLPGIRLAGLHAHIGSQVVRPDQHEALAQFMAGLATDLAEATGSPLAEVDLGGGFAIAYTADDPPAPGAAEMGRAVVSDWPSDAALILEPGRSLVGRAGVTLHTIGTVKRVPDVRTYVAVDGGMSDNVRPALYGARYEFLVAGRANAVAEEPVRIVGKHCESGDVLASDAMLPPGPQPGEILVTAATGAYAWAMASTYNQVPRSAVVFCRDGRAKVVIRRETQADLLRLQEGLPGPRR